VNNFISTTLHQGLFPNEYIQSTLVILSTGGVVQHHHALIIAYCDFTTVPLSRQLI